MATLGEVMSTKVFTVGADASMVEAAKGMVKGRFGSALIIEGSWLSGIVTERDVLRAAASGEDLNATKVRDWMDEGSAHRGTGHGHRRGGRNHVH